MKPSGDIYGLFASHFHSKTLQQKYLKLYLNTPVFSGSFLSLQADFSDSQKGMTVLADLLPHWFYIFFIHLWVDINNWHITISLN